MYEALEEGEGGVYGEHIIDLEGFRLIYYNLQFIVAKTSWLHSKVVQMNGCQYKLN